MSDRYYARAPDGRIVGQTYARDCAAAARVLRRMLDPGQYEVLRREQWSREFYLVLTFTV